MADKKKKKKWTVRLRNFVLKVMLGLFLCTILQVVCLKYINPLFTPNVAWEWAESLIERNPQKRPMYVWKNMEEISIHLQRCVLAAEDQRFFQHNGFDFSQIKQALKELVKKKRLRGASTISMQTSRSVFLLSSRHFTRKMAEVYYTVLIEIFWSKKRILEIYLNTVDWGTGVTGAEAAARTYFGKSARQLTPEEAALMTAILPNPHRWSVNKPTDYLISRQKRILKDMRLIRIP